RSPGAPSATKITRPFGSRPSASPPTAGAVSSSCRISVTRSSLPTAPEPPHRMFDVTRSAPRPIQIAPSVLPADFARLGEECRALGDAGVDRVQWDVMDGRFVPNLTFGPDVIAACRAHVDVLFEAHLMVMDPEELLPRYIEAGCELLIVHAETTRHLHRCL